MNDLRLRFVWVIARAIKHQEGVILPKWVRVIRNILYPLRWLYERNSVLHYDVMRDSYTIEGQQFTRKFFHAFNIEKNEPKDVRIYKDDYGIISIKKII